MVNGRLKTYKVFFKFLAMEGYREDDISAAIPLIIIGVMAAPKLSFYFNGSAKSMDVRIINNKAYVPLNDLTALFEGKVIYDKSKNKYSVISKDYKPNTSNNKSFNVDESPFLKGPSSCHYQRIRPSS
jgi:hypothetical protein